MFWHLLVLQVLLNVAKGLDENQSHEARASIVTATINPHQPLVWSGDHVTLTCSLSNSAVNVNSSDLYFYSSSPEISKKLQWERLNQTSICTNVTDISRNMSLENISCGFQNETLDQVTLNVADKIQCVVMNWRIMVCTWEKFQFSNDVNFTLLYKRRICPNKRDKLSSPCPNMKSNETHGECVWKLPKDTDDRSGYMHTSHCLKLKIQRPSSPMEFKPIGLIDVDIIVKPNPVSNCQVGSMNANRSVIITWTGPSKDLFHKAVYRVTLISKWSAFIKNTNRTEMLLENLIPNTNYTATVDCIPLTKKETMAGFWSDPVSVVFVSASDVPGATPRVTPGGYRETSWNLSFRGIELFFQPPDERYSHGQIKGYLIKGYQIKSYRVNYSSTDSPNNSFFMKNETKTSTNLLLESDADYSFTVEAQTESGYNSSLTLDPIFIPSQLKKPPFPKQFVVKDNGNGSYFLSWNSMSNVSSYTLYWCKSTLRPIFSLDVLQWKKFLPNQTSAELKAIDLPGRILRFFISAEKVLSTGHVISSGMLMSNCTYMLNGDLMPPHGFHVSGVDSSGLTAEWSQPDETSCLHRAYPDAYVIVYCIINKCHHENVTVKVNSSSDSYQINDLEPGTEYSIMIKSISEDGRTSRFEQSNERTADELSSQNDNNLIIVISIIGGVLCLLCVIIGLACYLHRWFKNKFNIKITTPERYLATNTGIPFGKSCYSYFDSSNGKSPCAAHTSVSDTSEVLLLRKETLSVSSSCHTNETSLPSSSSIETAKSDNVSVKSGNIAGYNKVVECPCLLANGSRTDSGTSLPSSISLSGSMDDAVFVNSLDD